MFFRLRGRSTRLINWLTGVASFRARYRMAESQTRMRGQSMSSGYLKHAPRATGSLKETRISSSFSSWYRDFTADLRRQLEAIRY